MLPGSTPIDGDPPAGDPVPVTPPIPPVRFETNAYFVEPGTLDCTTQPPASGCPTGVVGIIDVSGLTGLTASAPPSQVKLLYANTLAPGTYQIVFQPPPDTTGSIWWWSTSAGALQQVTGQPATINGQDVMVATITTDPTASLSFLAAASGSGVRAVSSVGSLTVGG
jgi:hypothetical protein